MAKISNNEVSTCASNPCELRRQTADSEVFLLLLAPSVKEKGQPQYDHFMFQIESNPKALRKINKHYFEL